MKRMTLALMGLLFTICFVGCTVDPGQVLDNTTDNTTDNTSDNTSKGKYVGAATCTACHNRRHESWAKTLHAEALDTLKSIGQEKNKACLVCHTVGYGEAGGFVDNATTPHLAGVQCENCHGAAKDHVNNVAEKSLRPKVDISAAICGKCHTDVHHPTFDEWSESGHGKMLDHPGDSFAEGEDINSCGVCHSGDARNELYVKGNDPADESLLLGVPIEEMNSQTCATCHDPHQQTGNAAMPQEGRDYQLRYPEVTYPTPTSDNSTPKDATRFNLCGQCHHSRGATWKATSRASHHSVQANLYLGEMDNPDNTTPPLVPNETSIHSFAPEQCITCHMHREPYNATDNTSSSGHKFDVSTKGCNAGIGCHPTEASVIALKASFQNEVQTALDSIKTRLGAESTWQYTSSDGPDNQTLVPDNIKKVRWLYYYITNDGSLGVHNPEYVRSMLNEADKLLAEEGK